MLAVMDPGMHPNDQTNAVLNLFDGEINVTETEENLVSQTLLRIKKLRNQDYIKNSIRLTK